MRGRIVLHDLRRMLNMTEIYCDNMLTPTLVAYCKAIVCNAFSGLTPTTELGKNFNLTGCAAHKQLPTVQQRTLACGSTAAEIAACPVPFWHWNKAPSHYTLMIHNEAHDAQRSCFRSNNLNDDHCKSKVHCLTLETLTVVYPDLFKLTACDAHSLSLKARKEIKKDSRHIRQGRGVPEGEAKGLVGHSDQ